MPTISARVPEEEKASIDEVAELLAEDRSSTIRKAIQEGLETIRFRIAAERFQSGDISIAEAAQIADCSVAEWLAEAHDANLTAHLTPEDVERDVEAALDL
jgi:predicted HTH domain antitoxin